MYLRESLRPISIAGTGDSQQKLRSTWVPIFAIMSSTIHMKKDIKKRIVISVLAGSLLAIASFGIRHVKTGGYPIIAAGYPVTYFHDARGVSVEGSLGIEDHFSLGSFLVDVLFFALCVNVVVEIMQNRIAGRRENS